MPVDNAIGTFFVEFSKFDIQSVGMALRALSRDSLFVEHAERLLDFDARLKLLERMAFARQVPASVMAELEACMLRARQLHVHREDVARNLTPERARARPPSHGGPKSRGSQRRNADLSRLAELESLLVPPLERIQEYTEEAVQLQHVMQGITAQLDLHIAGGLPATGTG